MIRLFVLSVVAALSAVTGVVGLAAPAHACSCAVASQAEHFQDADVVFTGRLVDRQEPPWRPVMSSGDPAALTFEVSRVYRGEAERLQVVETAMSGASCGLVIDGQGPFLVFTNHAPDGATLTASLCGGTRAIADGGPPAFGAGHPPVPGVEEPVDSSVGAKYAATVVAAVAVALAIAGWFRRTTAKRS
jgi:Tissue inhibitor of metalloproteinase